MTDSELKTTQLLIKQLDEKRDTEQIDKETTENVLTKDKSKIEKGETRLDCKVCDFKCKKHVTLRKHNNTKHNEAKYNCDKCPSICPSKDMLEEHMKDKHSNVLKRQEDIETEQNGAIEVGECYIWDDMFPTQEDYPACTRTPRRDKRD